MNVSRAKLARVPPNCTFEIDDYEQKWLYTKPFDYIHGRELNGFVADYDRLFSQAFKHLKSGGYLEMQSAEVHLYPNEKESEEKGKYTLMLTQYVNEAAEKFGKSFKQIHLWKEKMEKAGFVDVREVQYKVCRAFYFRTKWHFLDESVLNLDSDIYIYSCLLADGRRIQS